jgi:hypothetical protein
MYKIRITALAYFSGIYFKVLLSLNLEQVVGVRSGDAGRCDGVNGDGARGCMRPEGSLIGTGRLTINTIPQVEKPKQ